MNSIAVMLVRPEDFEYRRSCDSDSELSADEKAALLQAGLDKPFAVFGGGDGAMYEPPQECFFCCKKLTIPAVMWYGYQTPIWMHPTCAESLCHRLMRDVHELSKGKAYADQVLRRQKDRKRNSTDESPS